MAKEHCIELPIWQEVMQHWDVTPVEYLGRHLNENWLVAQRESRLVMRGYAIEPLGDIRYELEVLRRLYILGWPVPYAIDEPLSYGGRTWCLFTWLPGTCRVASMVEQRARGRLLAELHHAMVHLADLGQRDGCCLADELIDDHELTASLRAYEQIYPAEGHIMRWHLERAQQAFLDAAKETVETLVLHSDFATWNLLFDGERLTGILDFEGTHLNYRVADFALSWRGDQDEVIQGYQDVQQLSDMEQALIVPVFWSWLFLGVKKELVAMLAGDVQPHGFTWVVDHLLRRSKLLGRNIPAYPGDKGV